MDCEGFVYVGEIVLDGQILVFRFSEDFVMGSLPGNKDFAGKADVELDLTDGGFKGALMNFSILLWKPRHCIRLILLLLYKM